MSRTRTYSWGDAEVLARAARESDGLDFLSRIGSGELPEVPAGVTTGIHPVEVGDGWAIFEMTPEEWHFNPLGTVHGGMLAGLADSALGCAVHTKLKAGVGYTSLDLTIKFTRPATLDSGTLRCRGEVVTIGRRTASAEARITDGSGRVIAHAIATCLLLA
ncbi:PaaI family thioesterase [Microbacterium sp. 22303]|uniref:PaaI family thioesterase n=1 Tax=Microbacterium sp. 22303 TaxID=3453905 RepID=UPI003F830696